MSSLWEGGYHYKDNGNYTMSKVRINGIGGANPGTVGTMFFGTISGGAGAAISGGNFWDGAVTGMIVSGLNHTLHDAFDGEGETNPPSKSKSKSKLSEEALKLNAPVQTEFGGGAMELIGAGPIKGIKYLSKMAKNPNFVSSSVKQIGDFWEYSVKISGKNGSYTVYKKYLNMEGKTIKMFHDTYDKTSKFLHREFMNGQERIKIMWDGARSWFSKLY